MENLQNQSGSLPIEQPPLSRFLSDLWMRRFMILPATIILLALSIFPLLFSLGITFTNLRLLGPSALRFIGLENWVRLVTDQNFLISARNTIAFVIFGVTLQYVLGLGLAVLLNQRVRGLRFFRISLLLPMMMSPVAISYVIGKMMMSESYGPINNLLFKAHLPQLRWTLDPTMSMIILIIVDTWQWTPFFILILLAGLQGIPEELYDAVKVDGASRWQGFWHITFPLLLPLSATALLIRSLEAFKVIDIVRVVTGGGPGNSTETITLFAYDVGIKGGDIAFASTVAYALMFMVILYSTVFLAGARRVIPSTEE